MSYFIFNQSQNFWNFTLLNQFTSRYETIWFLVIVIILGSIILITIMGNVLVISAIIVERTLRTISNYLILSMAITDLIVAVGVMPISAINEVSSRWFLGVFLCDYWIFLDVLSCSASILHLVVIALDRYFAITKIDYKNKRTQGHFILSIVIIWTLSACIAIPSRFYLGRNSQNVYQQVVIEGKCFINTGYVYTFFSTVGAYYIPVLFIIVLYWRIYKTARKSIRKRTFNIKLQYQRSIKFFSKLRFTPSFTSRCRSLFRVNNCWRRISEISETLDFYPTFNDLDSCTINTYNIEDDEMSHFKYADELSLKSIQSPLKVIVKQQCQIQLIRLSSISSFSTICKGDVINELVKDLNEQKHKIEIKRERKATFTLCIITSCFILCWTPFFIHAVVHPFCNDYCKINDIYSSIFLWLGYLNCLFNPFIYTFFSPEFRAVIKHILTGHYLNKYKS